jgi:hypothetical protein
MCPSSCWLMCLEAGADSSSTMLPTALSKVQGGPTDVSLEAGSGTGPGVAATGAPAACMGLVTWPRARDQVLLHLLAGRSRAGGSSHHNLTCITCNAMPCLVGHTIPCGTPMRYTTWYIPCSLCLTGPAAAPTTGRRNWWWNKLLLHSPRQAPTAHV